VIDLGVIVPVCAQPYIERQRFSRKRLADGFWNKPEQCEAKYVASLADDYQTIRPFLPEEVEIILDIGCGMAGVDVLLRRHYPEAKLWLLDGDGDEQRDGWNETLGAFSSRAAADELLAANGTQADRWIDVNTPEALQADLVISFASWGFHYPLDTYDVTGYCIADLRKVQERPRGRLVREYPKFRRCAWHQVEAAP
jgi:hypothetical protein